MRQTCKSVRRDRDIEKEKAELVKRMKNWKIITCSDSGLLLDYVVIGLFLGVMNKIKLIPRETIDSINSFVPNTSKKFGMYYRNAGANVPDNLQINKDDVWVVIAHGSKEYPCGAHMIRNHLEEIEGKLKEKFNLTLEDFGLKKGEIKSINEPEEHVKEQVEKLKEMGAKKIIGANVRIEDGSVKIIASEGVNIKPGMELYINSQRIYNIDILKKQNPSIIALGNNEIDLQLKTLGQSLKGNKCFSITLGNGALTAVSLAYALANFDVKNILVYESQDKFKKTFEKVYDKIQGSIGLYFYSLKNFD